MAGHSGLRHTAASPGGYQWTLPLGYQEGALHLCFNVLLGSTTSHASMIQFQSNGAQANKSCVQVAFLFYVKL